MENADAHGKRHQESDSVNLGTNSLGSLVRIDELYVGIDDVYSPDSNGRWGHFSIRGYVSEMRKKNRRMCAPFDTEDDNLLEEQLLPMEVRKFRYWRCRDCILGNCSRIPTGDHDLVSEPPPNGEMAEGFCASMASGDKVGATKCGSQNFKTQINDGVRHPKMLPSLGKRSVCSKTTSGIELVERAGLCIPFPDGRDICCQTDRGCLNKKNNVSELEHGETPCDKDDAANYPETEAFVDASKSTMSPSIQVDDQEDVSTESDEALIRSIEHRRKTKKVRLLTDLLSGKGNKRGDVSIDDSSAASHEVGLLAPGDARGLSEDVGKNKLKLPSKRRPQVENSHNSEVKGLTNVLKKMRSARVNVDRPNVTREVCRSEAEESIFSETKQPKSLSSPVLLNDDQTFRGSHAAGAIDNNASTASGRNEKDKGKRPVVQNGDTYLTPAYRSSLGEVLAKRKQGEPLQFVSTTNQSLRENDTSTNVGLDLSLGSPMSSEATTKLHIFTANPTVLQPKDRPGYPPCKGKSVAEDVGTFNNSSLGQSGRKGLPWDLNERIGHSTTLSFDKQRTFTPFDYRDSEMQGMMDFCNPSLRAKNVEGHGNSTPPNRHSDQRFGKAVDQGSSDDIPMELVGFLAEKQYEKRIQMEQGYSAGEHQFLSSRSGTAIGGFNKVHGNGPMSWFSRDNPGTTRSSHANAINGVGLAVDNRMTAESRSRFEAYKWSCQEDQRKMFGAVPEDQQILSTSIQFPYPYSSIGGTRPSEVAKPVWLSKNDNLLAAQRMSQKYTSVLSGSMANKSRVELQHQGRTISDIKSEETRIQNKKQQMANMPGIGEHLPTSRPFSNQHSNESIPAMQLLSLVQNGMSSDAACDGDANRLMGKHFFSSNYQQKLSLDGRSRSYDRPLLSNQNQRSVVGNAGPCLTPRPSPLYSTTAFRSQEIGESRNWAQHQQQIGGSGSLHISPGSKLDRQNWDKLGAAYPVQFVQPNSGMERQNWDRPTVLSGSSGPMKFQLHSGRFEGSSPVIDLEAYTAVGTSSGRRHSEEEKQCVLNQNPAEFSSPESGNEYTLSGGDIKLLHAPRRSVNMSDGRGRRRRQRGNATRVIEQTRGYAS